MNFNQDLDNGDVNDYLKTISQYPVITREIEHKLLSTIKNPGSTHEQKASARQELITGNLRLVVKIACRYKKRMAFSQDNIPLIDLIGEGNLELTKAITRYDESKYDESKGSLSTFLWTVIHNGCKKLSVRTGKVKMPAYYHAYDNQLQQLQRQYKDDLDALTDEIVMKELKISKRVLKTIRTRVRIKCSLEALVDSDGVAIELPDETAINASDMAETNDSNVFISKFINELDEKNRNIMKMYLYDRLDMVEIGKTLGISRQAIKLRIDRCNRKIIFNARKELNV